MPGTSAGPCKMVEWGADMIEAGGKQSARNQAYEMCQKARQRFSGGCGCCIMYLYAMQCGPERRSFYKGSGSVVNKSCAAYLYGLAQAIAKAPGTIGDANVVIEYMNW